jgi:hypothetical protein
LSGSENNNQKNRAGAGHPDGVKTINGWPDYAAANPSMSLPGFCSTAKKLTFYGFLNIIHGGDLTGS